MLVDRRDGSPTPPPRVRLRLFGQLRLEVGEDDVVIDSSRGRALIGFLVLGGDGPRSREQAAFALWPDSSDAQARTNLRKVLHGLRRDARVDRLIETTPRTLRWRRELTDEIDVDAFEEAVDATARNVGDPRAIDVLERARELCTGHLLADCWDEWLIDHRSRFAELYVSALRRLTESLATAGLTGEAIDVAQELVRVEPLQESSHRLLMGLHHASGDRAAAARVYHQCVRTLRDELGVEPSAETNAVYDELTDQRNHRRAPPAGGVIRTPDAARHLIGRAVEWETLVGAWPEPDSGSAHLLFVTGEAGVGKTHLAESFAGWATRRGAVVARARSFPTEGDLGFGLVISWLRSATFRDTLASLDEHDRSTLARLLPELGNAADDSFLDYGERRQRLLDAFSRVLRVLARDRVVLLIADDAQWADEQSLQAVHYVVRANADVRLVVLATVRREDVGWDSSFQQVAAALGTAELATELPLGRFGRADSAALVRQLVQEELSDEALDRLHAESEGNPLFIVEAVRAGWDPDAPELPLSPRLRHVIDARVGQLSDDARALLQTAVTVGREFRVPVVQAASGLDDVPAVRALDELWRRGFVNEFSVDAYDFTHGKIRDAVYEGMSPAMRREHHRRLAAALKEVDRGSLDAVSGRIAHHLEEGGAAADAVGWYVRAARQAQRRYAPEEALRLLDRASNLVESLPDDVKLRRELEVLSERPAPLGWIDGFSSDRLVAVQERAGEIADALGVEPQPTILRSLAFLRLCQDRYAEGSALGDRLSRMAEADGDRGLLLEGVYLRGVAAFWEGRFEDARAAFERVGEDYTPDLRADHLLRFGQDAQIICRSRLANTFRFLGRVADARATREIAVREATELGHPWTLNLTLIFASLLAVDLGEQDRLAEYATAMGSLAMPPGLYGLITQAVVGASAAQAGRIESISKVRTALDECGPVNPAPAFRPIMWRLLVAAHEAAGSAPGDGNEACEQALRAAGSRIWWPDIEQARARFATAG